MLKHLEKVLILIILIVWYCHSEDWEKWYQKNKDRLRLFEITYEESKLTFEKNKKMIENFNKKNLEYKLSLDGPFVGIPIRKLKEKLLNQNRKNYNFSKILNNNYKLNRNYPDSIDYRNYLSPIRDQGSCGCCYAFGSLGAIEGRLNIKYNNKYDLPEQEIVSCSTSYGNNGCNGGISYNVYEYVKDKKLSFELYEPYCACDYYSCKDVTKYVKIDNYKSVKGSMIEALQNGPIDIAMDVENTFYYYSSGYYYETNCNTDANKLNHEMTAVGYGYNNGNLYYIIRNSWGESWGLSGYAYIYDGVCGISSDPVEPIGVDLI